MADFDITIEDSGTLPIASNQRLTYSEGVLLGKNVRGVLYAVTASPFAVLLPNTPNDDATQAWFHQTIELSRTLHEQQGRHALPLVALGRHTTFACDVLVIQAPTGTFATTLTQLQQNNQLIAAERLVLRTMLDLVDVLSALQQTQQTLLLNSLEILLLPNENGSLQPTLFPWANYTPASDVVALNASLEIGRWLYTSLMGYAIRPPLSPFDDTAWQARLLAYTPQGAISVGLRYLLTALFHSPVESRFVTAEGISFNGLRHALNEWHNLTLTLGSVLDQKSVESLAPFSHALPHPYQFNVEHSEAQAIWLDLWWRIHQIESDESETLTSQEITRSHALLRAKVEQNEDTRVQDAVNRALAEENIPDALAILQERREAIETIASKRDITLWALWQHLGRWITLLGLSTPREVIRHIGSTLHRLATDDSAPALDILINTLQELNAPDILREAKLRQSALSYRQSGEWAEFGARFAGELANVPPYLRLPSPASEDFYVQPYTLQGQLVGRVSDVMARITEAITVGNQEVALALVEYARTLPLPVRQRENADMALKPLGDLASFLSRNQRPLSDFQTGIDLLESDAVQNAQIRQQVEQGLLAMANRASEQVNAATDSKKWDDIRAASPAYHLLTQRGTRHLIEQLRVANQQEARSIEQSAQLNMFERLQSTYHDLFMMVKQAPLWNITQTERSSDALQAQAKQILDTLNNAVTLGMPMDDLIANDENTRQQWQQLISDSLGALQRMEHVTQDVETLRQRLQGDGGFGAQLQALNASVDALRTQIDGGTASTPSILQQLSALRAQLGDIEHGTGQQIEQGKREMRVTQDDIKRQLEANDITLQRHTQQISGNSNLLQDARERLAMMEHELIGIQKHESDLLCTYLDAMPEPNQIDRINSVLDTVDGVVYAMRRCPVEAFDDGCHAAWMNQFNQLRDRFEQLASSRLSWRDRRNLKANLRNIRALFMEVEEEANAKAAAYRRIFTKPADIR